MKQALLVLSDGTAWQGEAFGHDGETIGEVVFNTSMSGYQEILSDPSYRGQLVTMTSPHIGNYGVNPLDMESDRVQAAGLIVREASRRASNWRATGTLGELLSSSGVVAITGVDTRAVTRRIRDGGASMGAIVHGASLADVPAIVDRIRSAPSYDEQDFVAVVSVRRPMRVRLVESGDLYVPHRVELVEESVPWPDDSAGWPECAVIDYGVKYSILRHLASLGLRVTLYPHDVSAEFIQSRNPAGILLSNGPGDPARLDGAVATIRSLIGSRPMFGICLGHQLLGRAIGAETFKLKFGHRGPNQPVLAEHDQRVEITSQNHGYAVRLDHPGDDVEVTHWNLNDRTIEGLALPRRKAFSVQHHPEAGPGPHDAVRTFHHFREMITPQG